MDNYKSVRCVHCRYYQITWDVDKPYGCNKLGFKTNILPSSYVINVSGNECQSFINKREKK